MTISTTVLRPNGQVKIVQVSVTGAGTLNQATSDDLDSSFIFGQADKSFARLSLGTLSLGASTRVQQARIRARTAASANGDAQTLQVRFRDPVANSKTGVNATSGPLVVTRGLATISTQEGGYETAYPGGITWIQERLDRLELEVWFYASPASLFARIYELYVDLVTMDRPTVSAVTITGNTTSTRPTVTFSYTGDVQQTRSRTRVFSSAQYGATGFDPASSPALWDSGDVIGDSETIDVGVDIPNGLTIKAYTKVGHDWDGPEGPVWWSTYVASAAATISVLPPIVPTLTVTTDPSLPGYRVMLDALAPVNLGTANQSSLETDTAGWASLANVNLARNVVWSADGAASLGMTSVAAGTMLAEWSSRPLVQAGASYSASAVVRSATVSRSTRVGIRWFDYLGALIGASVFGSVVASTTGTDTTVSALNLTAPANAYSASVVLEVQGTAAAGEIHRWDKIALVAGPVATWTLGGAEGVATVVLERLEKVDSRRGDTRNWAHAQLVSGGGLTLGTDGFTARGTSLLRSAPLDGPHPANSDRVSQMLSGARRIVWRPLAGAFNALDIGLPNGVTTEDPTPPYLMPATPGRAQTVSMYLRGSSAVNARIFVIPVNHLNTQVGAGTEVPSATTALSTSVYTRYSATITPPAGTVYLRASVELPNGDANLDVSLTGIQCEPGTKVTDLAPGSGVYFPTWVPVRSIGTAVATSPGQHYFAHDHEVPGGRPVLYRARSVSGALASAPSAPIAAYLPAPVGTLLKDPFQPENSMVVFLGPRWSETRDRVQQTWQPLGRDAAALGIADPLVKRDWIGNPDPSYDFSVENDVALARIRFLIGSDRPILIQFIEGGQAYLIPTGAESVAPAGSDSSGEYAVTMGFLATGRPA